MAHRRVLNLDKINGFPAVFFTTNSVGRIMTPRDAPALISGTCEPVTLRGKRDFPDVIKVIDLEVER